MRFSEYSDRSKTYVLKNKLEKLIPEDAPDHKIVFYGSEVLIFTDNIKYFIENEKLVKELAQKFRVRIKIRLSEEKRKNEDETINELEKLLPEIKNYRYWFNQKLGELNIEVPHEIYDKLSEEKEKLKEFFEKTGWFIVLHRKPIMDSAVSKSIHQILFQYQSTIFKMFKSIGEKIRKPASKDKIWVQLMALGGYQEVGRSCHYLQTPTSNIIIDCGVSVGVYLEPWERYPYLAAIRDTIGQNNLDSIILTHAHLDHIGYVPVLSKFEIPIYTTEPTRELMLLLLSDYIDVLRKTGVKPPYEKEDIIKTIQLTVPCKYNEVYDISPDARVTFFNAGHILGSSIVHIHIGEGDYNLVIANDFKLSGTTVLGESYTKITHINGLILESTYGGKEDISPSREEAEKQLIEEIKATIEKGGKVLIPVFAVGRAQEILYTFTSRRDELENINIYIDGMVKEATAIYTKYPEYLSKEVAEKIKKGENPFLDDRMSVVKSEDERQEICKSDEPCVIIASSGMLVGGPSLEYFSNLCENSKNKIIFVGYQAQGTLGRKIVDGEKKIPILIEGKRIIKEVNMEVVKLSGFSGHSDRKELEKTVKLFRNKIDKLILCHGEPEKIKDLYYYFSKQRKYTVYAPNNLEAVRLR